MSHRPSPRTRRALAVIGVTAGVAAVVAASTGRCEQRAGHGRAGALGRRVRRARNRWRGTVYEIRGRHPSADVSDLVLADRVRSTIGPLQRRLDLPHVHVMVNDHVVTLHGDVASSDDVTRLVDEILGISGVRHVNSFLHLGLITGDTRPSEGRRATPPPSPALVQLIDAARRAGASDAPLFAVHAVLDAFFERIPPGERRHLISHLPRDVRALTEPPHVYGAGTARLRTADELFAAVSAHDPRLDDRSAAAVTAAVVAVLRQLVPEERDDVEAVLPHELRQLWMTPPNSPSPPDQPTDVAP